MREVNIALQNLIAIPVKKLFKAKSPQRLHRSEAFRCPNSRNPTRLDDLFSGPCACLEIPSTHSGSHNGRTQKSRHRATKEEGSISENTLTLAES